MKELHLLLVQSMSTMEKFQKTIINNYTYEDIKNISEYLLENGAFPVEIGLICGTGLGDLAQIVKKPVIFDYKTIPNFPIATVEHHAGKLIFGYVQDKPIVCMQGRIHFYEGYPLKTCIMPVRLMKILGIKYLIVTNAAGGLNSNLREGDIMLIRDHVDLMGLAGHGSLTSDYDPRFGSRFFSMTNAYDPTILSSIKREEYMKDGVYTCVGGPNFETIADLMALKQLGIDAVGMSTVHEIVAARQSGIICFAFSLITNLCVIDNTRKEEVDSEKMLKVANMRLNEMLGLINEVITNFAF